MSPHSCPSRAVAVFSAIGLVAGCVAAPADTAARAVAALTVGPELTLLPSVPGASLPVEALGHAATAAAGAVRATAWVTPAGAGSVAFWSSAGGLLAQADLGSVTARPLVASDGRVFLVAWQAAAGVVAARFDAAGTRLDVAPLTVSAAGGVDLLGDALACAYDGRDFVLAYAVRPSGVEVARVSAAGAVRDRRAVPLLGTSAAERVRVAASSAGYLVAATGVYATSFLYRQLAYARLDASLALLDAAPRTLGATPRERGLEDVAGDGADYLLLWSDEATPTAGAARLLAARVAASSGDAAAAVDVAPGTTTHPARAAWAERVAGGYLIARYDGASFVTRQLRDAGTLVEPAPVARAVGMGLVGQVARARDGANLTLTWAATTAAGTRALSVASLAADGAAGPTAQPVTVPGGTDARSIGLGWDGSHFLTAWSETAGSWAARTSRAGDRVDARGVTIARAQTEALASTPGQHVLVRGALGPSGETSFSAQRYDASLAPVGAELRFFGAERQTVFWGVGGPAGYLLATGVNYFSGLQLDLHLLRTDGTLARSFEVYRFRTTGGSNAFAASRTAWAAVWSPYDILTGASSLRVNLYTPAGEFAAVPLDRPLPTSATPAEVTVASDGTDFLVAWGQPAAGGSTWGLRVRADGTALDAAPFAIGPSGGPLRAVWDGRSYTVAWSPARLPTPATWPILAARVDATGAVLDRTPVTLVEGARASVPFALATDGAGTVALAYGRASVGGVVRAQLRLIQWDAPSADGGVDAATDGSGDAQPDAAQPDVAQPDVAIDVAADARPDAPADAPGDASPDLADARGDAATPPPGGPGCQCATPRRPASPRGAACLAGLAGLALVIRRRRGS